jgi:hypothetical protein
VANLIWSIVAALGGVLVIAVVFYYWTAVDHDRADEEDARRFFDEHGHWPDEPPPSGAGPGRD